MLFLSKLSINIPNHMVSKVVTDIQALKFTILAQFLEKILIKILKVLLHLARIERVTLGVNAGGDHIGTLVHVGEKERRADAGLGVEARTPVTVPARTDLEVEWTVHPIFLRSENGRQVLRHS